jgi:phosphoribosylglycinamide formyltransferase-1
MVLRIGVLVSGRGSNMESVLKSVERGVVKEASVAVVVSNRQDARALRVAKAHGVPTAFVDDKGSTPEEHASRLAQALESHGVKPGVGLVLLAGYMKILPRSFLSLYPGRIMNIHPSLLPAFPGRDAQRQALEHGVKVSGCTVHFVVPEVDAGPIIVQTAVEVREGDDEASLSARILRQEHKAYPTAVKLFAEGRLSIEGRRVLVAP